MNLDVLIIGAGLSGIDVAYRLQTECPDKTYAILEARPRVGGTWDLFRYPGIRSDSDIETLGFPFRDWKGEKSIADGHSIRQYIEETARLYGIDKKIRFNSRALKARWSNTQSLWTVSLQDGKEIKCRFLYTCTGYYNYSQGHQPRWPGIDDFKGQLIHPQSWPEDFKASGKKIVVIGSGATAVTLVPALAEQAELITMLQRTPTYIVSRPSIDPLTQKIRTILPGKLGHQIVRLKNISFGVMVYQHARKFPERTRRAIMAMAQRQLPDHIDVGKDFNPPYRPWDQRLCLTPDGDFFNVLRSGKARIVTDEIERLLPEGILLKSGKVLEADVIISATGLDLQLLGGMKLFIDERAVDLSQHFSYKGVFLNDVPNFAVSLGYTNASWTLKCDLAARYFCRLLRHMDRAHHKVFCPNLKNKHIQSEALIGLTSSYIKRSEKLLPKQGLRRPWRLNQNYFLDWLNLRMSPIDDGYMIFTPF